MTLYWDALLNVQESEVKDTLRRLYEDFGSLERMSNHLGVSLGGLRKKMLAEGLLIGKRGGKRAYKDRESL